MKKKTTDQHKITTEIYQSTLIHKEFAQSLNIVIIIKTHLKTSSQSHVILFFSDLELSYEKIIDYYRLRFQIEFNFRDAKQFSGLEDFMNIKETGVTNAANMSLFYGEFIPLSVKGYPEGAFVQCSGSQKSMARVPLSRRNHKTA